MAIGRHTDSRISSTFTKFQIYYKKKAFGRYLSKKQL